MASDSFLRVFGSIFCRSRHCGLQGLGEGLLSSMEDSRGSLVLFRVPVGIQAPPGGLEKNS